MPMFQMFITSSDPDRYLPPSWNFEAQGDASKVWNTAEYIASGEKVAVEKVVDADTGRNVPRP